MNKLIALCSFVLSLYGCDAGGGTFVHRSSVDGSDTLYSKVEAQPGVARFECLRSASGRCHYTVFRRDCGSMRAPTAGSTSKRGASCLTAPVERFALAEGDSRQLPGLPRFRLCVSADGGMPRPDCELPAPMAAR